MKERYIEDLQSGEKIENIQFVLKSIKKQKTRDGRDYYDVELTDKTGNIMAKIWNEGVGNCEVAEPGSVVELTATVGEYREKQQLTISYMATAKDFDLADFLPSTEKDIEEMWSLAQAGIASVKNQNIKDLLDLFFGDPEFVKQYKSAPAAERLHHAFIGGLLQHSTDMLTLYKSVKVIFPKLDNDLMVAGILLHDVGKLEELAVGNTITRTIAGGLVGHLTLGVCIVDKAIDKINGFDEILRSKLIHLIVSHHGQRDFGSPEVPKTREAFALHHVDLLSSKLDLAQKFIEERKDSVEPFSEYIRLLETRLYLD